MVSLRSGVGDSPFLGAPVSINREVYQLIPFAIPVGVSVSGLWNTLYHMVLGMPTSLFNSCELAGFCISTTQRGFCFLAHIVFDEGCLHGCQHVTVKVVSFCVHC